MRPSLGEQGPLLRMCNGQIRTRRFNFPGLFVDYFLLLISYNIIRTFEADAVTHHLFVEVVLLTISFRFNAWILVVPGTARGARR